MTKPKTPRRRKAAKSEAIAARDSLPFFKKGRGTGSASWWNVTPSGSYAADLETGKAYARAFLPVLTFNAGASNLAVIVSHMAIAGRDLAKNPKEWCGIDAVALGFMMEVANMLQYAIKGIAIATVAIERPQSDMGPKFVKLAKTGEMLFGPSRSTLSHNPNSPIWDVRQ